jgi:hypothetical protein
MLSTYLLRTNVSKNLRIERPEPGGFNNLRVITVVRRGAEGLRATALSAPTEFARIVRAL